MDSLENKTRGSGSVVSKPLDLELGRQIMGCLAFLSSGVYSFEKGVWADKKISQTETFEFGYKGGIKYLKEKGYIIGTEVNGERHYRLTVEGYRYMMEIIPKIEMD